ncbi:hypothetical protein [Oryza sativa Japonica Group]|uniref:Uncharacterized protein n=1 Tax=Oryza sativa subsp. japonica TaxID=39947 RepID=Q5JK48_ORYSJ|nr:hypothetical protein [Oryza sativa Japonica Group]
MRETAVSAAAVASWLASRCACAYADEAAAENGTAPALPSCVAAGEYGMATEGSTKWI